jgi:AcrR family transcriptional regulator
MALDRDVLARAALAVLDAEGVSGLTMRRLAAEVGAAPMSAYTHVRSKRDLLDLALERVVSEVDLPESDGRLRRPVRRIASGLRTALHDHPGAAELIRADGLRGPSAAALEGRLGDVLRGAGLPETEVPAAGEALRSLMVAAALSDDGADATFKAALEIVLDGIAGRRKRRAK